MPALTLEALLTSRNGFALVTASPLQRAVCRIIDGLPLGELAARDEVRAAIGDVDALPKAPPAEVLILSGIRTAKSLSAAATAVRASQTCDMTGLGAGETPRVSVVSLTTDLSKVVFDHIVGNVLARPALRALLIGEPTADALVLRHPSGRPVEIKVVAGARAGASLVARWSAGCIFDEAPRMIGSDDGVVNYDDCRAAVIGRDRLHPNRAQPLPAAHRRHRRRRRGRDGFEGHGRPIAKSFDVVRPRARGAGRTRERRAGEDPGPCARPRNASFAKR
jgi:hypothetical protein